MLSVALAKPAMDLRTASATPAHQVSVLRPHTASTMSRMEEKLVSEIERGVKSLQGHGKAPTVAVTQVNVKVGRSNRWLALGTAVNA